MFVAPVTAACGQREVMSQRELARRRAIHWQQRGFAQKLTLATGTALGLIDGHDLTRLQGTIAAFGCLHSRWLEQLQEPQFAYLSNAHGAFPDKVRNKFGKQGTRNIRGDAFDQLRRNLCDEVFGRACQAVLVADAIIHAGRISNRTLLKLPARSSVQSCARNRTITKSLDDVV